MANLTQEPTEPEADFEDFSEAMMLRLGAALERSAAGAANRQAVAQRMVETLYAELRTKSSIDPACVLVRCFQTAPFAQLPMEYQHAADDLLEQAGTHLGLRCLALLATIGERQVWNDVATSVNHQSIPLPSIEVVRRAPMISRLLEQIGVPAEWVVARDDGEKNASAIHMEAALEKFNVFHIEEAEGSPYIPAQSDFVMRYGVRSVVGVGGLLPDGELFVVILFSRVHVSRELAELFRGLAVSVRKSVLRYDTSQTFEHMRA